MNYAVFMLSFISLTLLMACSSGSKASLKILRVGTTGDYAPFSERVGQKFVGIDIEMANALARSLGRELQLIQTSWPTLSSDLESEQFDLAMSGITVTDERRKSGLFSEGYYHMGKMGVARCKDKTKYPTLKAIDTENTRVAINPGGTNEAFARASLKKAKLVLFKNNSEIFQKIIEGAADVMLTDSPEVYFQSKRHHGKLCPTMDKPLTQKVLAIFIKKDQTLKRQVDRWLFDFERSGQKKRLFDKYL